MKIQKTQHRNSRFGFYVFDKRYAKEFLQLKEELIANKPDLAVSSLKEMVSDVKNADPAKEYFSYLENFNEHSELIREAETEKKFALMEVNEVLDSYLRGGNEKGIINYLYFKWRTLLFDSEWYYCHKLSFSYHFLFQILELQAPATWQTLKDPTNLPLEELMWLSKEEHEAFLNEPNDFNFFCLDKAHAEQMLTELQGVRVPDDRTLQVQLDLFIDILRQIIEDKAHVVLERCW